LDIIKYAIERKQICFFAGFTVYIQKPIARAAVAIARLADASHINEIFLFSIEVEIIGKAFNEAVVASKNKWHVRVADKSEFCRRMLELFKGFFFFIKIFKALRVCSMRERYFHSTQHMMLGQSAQKSPFFLVQDFSRISHTLVCHVIEPLLCCFGKNDPLFVVSPDYLCAVAHNKYEAFSWIGAVPDNISKTKDKPCFFFLNIVEHFLQCFEICVNIRDYCYFQIILQYIVSGYNFQGAYFSGEKQYEINIFFKKLQYGDFSFFCFLWYNIYKVFKKFFRYMDSNPNFEVSNAKLKYGLWYIRHKILLRKLLISSLVILIVFFYSYTLWKVVDLYIIHGGESAAIIEQFFENSDSSPTPQNRIKVQDLQIENIKILPSSGNRKDVVATVSNPNAHYAARHVAYDFISGDKVLFQDESFVWPGDEKIFAALGIEDSKISNNQVQLQIREISWERYQDFQNIIAQKANISLSAVEYIPANRIAQAAGFTGIVKFSVTNKSIYNYYDPGFYIILLNGSEIVGVNFTRINILRSLQTVPVQVNVLSPVSNVTSEKIIPEINILDEKAFFIDEIEKSELK